MSRDEFIATFILQNAHRSTIEFIIADAVKAADAIYGKYGKAV